MSNTLIKTVRTVALLMTLAAACPATATSQPDDLPHTPGIHAAPTTPAHNQPYNWFTDTVVGRICKMNIEGFLVTQAFGLFQLDIRETKILKLLQTAWYGQGVVSRTISNPSSLFFTMVIFSSVLYNNFLGITDLRTHRKFSGAVYVGDITLSTVKARLINIKTPEVFAGVMNALNDVASLHYMFGGWGPNLWPERFFY